MRLSSKLDYFQLYFIHLILVSVITYITAAVVIMS